MFHKNIQKVTSPRDKVKMGCKLNSQNMHSKTLFLFHQSNGYLIKLILKLFNELVQQYFKCIMGNVENFEMNLMNMEYP